MMYNLYEQQEYWIIVSQTSFDVAEAIDNRCFGANGSMVGVEWRPSHASEVPKGTPIYTVS